MDIFLNTYWMKPHTVMRSLLYEGYRKLGLKQINSADLESQFTRVIRLIVKKKKNKQKKKKTERYVVNISIPHSIRNHC